jgi:hypothetical protein
VKQCILNNGSVWQVVWIPVQFAVKGRYLRLVDSDGWRVVEVCEPFQANVNVPRGYLSGGVFHHD